MSPYVEREQIIELQFQIQQWVLKAGWTKLNTADFLIDHAVEEIDELHQSTIVAKGNIRDVRVLEEVADPTVYILQLLDVKNIPMLIHYVDKMMSSNRRVNTELITSYGHDLAKKRSVPAATRALASVLCFALQNELDPIELTQIKHFYNLFRYPPFEVRNGYDGGETRRRQKREEQRQDWKATVLFPKLAQVSRHRVHNAVRY